MPVDIAMYERMVSRHRDVFNNANVTVLATSDFNFVFASGSTLNNKLLCVDDMEHFLLIVRKTLKDNKILLGLIDPHNVDNLVLVGNFKR